MLTGSETGAQALRGMLICGAVLGLGAGAASAADPMKLTFAMPTTPSPYLLPFFVAQDQGWYEKAGLKVEEKVVTGDVNCLRAVLSHDADFTDIGPNTAMQGFISGGKIRILGSWQPIVDYRLVARAGEPATLKDLADKRWAISSAGGMLQALPKMMMQKHGIDPSKAQFLSVGGYAARYQAVVGKTVDATLLDTSLTIRGERDGKIKLVSSVADDFPSLGFVYIVSRDTAVTDPAERKAFEILMREAIRGARFIVDQPRAAAELMEKRLKDTDVDGMTQALQEMNRLGVWGLNGGTERRVFDFSEQVYHQTGEVAQDVKYEQLVDPSLVEAALAELGRR